MGRFGLLDGMSDYATRFYLGQINRQMMLLEGRRADVVLCMGGRHWNRLVRNGDWDELTEEMIAKVKVMRRAGAKFVVIPSFTLHRVADVVQAESGVPVLRMDDYVARAVATMKAQRVAIISTNLMGWGYLEDFYQRMGGHECVYCKNWSQLGVNQIALENRIYDKETRRRRLWTYVEAVGGISDRVDAILNCSVEMTRMVGLRNVRKPFKEEARWLPVVNAVDLHIAAIVRVALASEAYFPV